MFHSLKMLLGLFGCHFSLSDHGKQPLVLLFYYSKTVEEFSEGSRTLFGSSVEEIEYNCFENA